MPPPKKPSDDDTLAAGFGQTSPVQDTGAIPPGPMVTVPGAGEQPKEPALMRKEAGRIMDPAWQDAVTAATLEAAGMWAPTLGSAAMGAMAPRLVKRGPIAAPGRIETLGSMARAGAGAGAGTEVGQMGQNTSWAPAAKMIGDAVSLLTPSGIKKLLDVLAPRATSETARIARQAEKEGFRLEPKQVAETAPKGYTAHDVQNNIRANEIMTGSAGDPAPHVTREWLNGREQHFDRTYDTIFSPGNIFAASHNQQVLANTVLQGQGLNRQIDGFISEATTKWPYLTTHAYVPLPGGGLRQNPNFLPPDGAQLREARDAIRKLQRSTDPQTRAYGNRVWMEQMNHIRAADPHLGRMLEQTNSQYRSYMAIEDMELAGKISQGNIDLQHLDQYLRSGMAGENYIRGVDTSVPARLGRYGKNLRIANQPPAQAKNMIPESLIVGGSSLAGGLIPMVMGAHEFSYPGALAGALAASTGSYPARKAILSGIRAGTDPAGRAIQRLPRPQQEDLATRSKIIQRLVGTREGLSAILPEIMRETGIDIRQSEQ